MSNSVPSLDEFYKSALGRYVLEWEQRQLDKLVSDCFGYNALQLGGTSIDFLRANRIPLKIFGDKDLKLLTAMRSEDRKLVLMNFEEFPFSSESFDLVILPHTLECVEDPHSLLREVHRVLIPNGRLILTGFNLMSLWGLRFNLQRLGARPFLPGHQFLTVFRLKDWMDLLNMNVDRGMFGCYEPTWTAKRAKRKQWMEKSGDRWWPQCGAVYALSARKSVPGSKLVGKALKNKNCFVGRGRPANVRKEPAS